MSACYARTNRSFFAALEANHTMPGGWLASFRRFLFAFCVLALPIDAEAKEAVLVVPVRIPAFDEIEDGLRDVIGSALSLHVICADDFRGKSGGVVEAALAYSPTVILPVGTTMCRAFLAAADSARVPPTICVAVSQSGELSGRREGL